VWGLNSYVVMGAGPLLLIASSSFPPFWTIACWHQHEVQNMENMQHQVLVSRFLQSDVFFPSSRHLVRTESGQSVFSFACFFSENDDSLS
jgi:hypothetical protein